MRAAAARAASARDVPKASPQERKGTASSSRVPARPPGSTQANSLSSPKTDPRTTTPNRARQDRVDERAERRRLEQEAADERKERAERRRMEQEAAAVKMVEDYQALERSYAELEERNAKLRAEADALREVKAQLQLEHDEEKEIASAQARGLEQQLQELHESLARALAGEAPDDVERYLMYSDATRSTLANSQHPSTEKVHRLHTWSPPNPSIYEQYRQLDSVAMQDINENACNGSSMFLHADGSTELQAPGPYHDQFLPPQLGSGFDGHASSSDALCQEAFPPASSLTGIGDRGEAMELLGGPLLRHPQARSEDQDWQLKEVMDQVQASQEARREIEQVLQANSEALAQMSQLTLQPEQGQHRTSPPQRMRSAGHDSVGGSPRLWAAHVTQESAPRILYVPEGYLTPTVERLFSGEMIRPVWAPAPVWVPPEQVMVQTTLGGPGRARCWTPVKQRLGSPSPGVRELREIRVRCVEPPSQSGSYVPPPHQVASVQRAVSMPNRSPYY